MNDEVLQLNLAEYMEIIFVEARQVPLTEYILNRRRNMLRR